MGFSDWSSDVCSSDREYLTGTSPIFPDGHYESAPSVTGADGKPRRDWGAVVPMCTGPYKLVDYQPGQSVTLEKNPDYFEGSPKGKPSIGKIVYRTIKDTETQVAELLTGGIDWKIGRASCRERVWQYV